jgi:hypothetical protein
VKSAKSKLNRARSARARSRPRKTRKKAEAKRARSLSEINHSHWWLTHQVWNDATAMSRDEQKAAVFYEAYRRVPKIQDAWLKDIRGPEAVWRFGWQMFVASVVQYLPKTWLELGWAKNVFLQYLPEMLPPAGYSVWPAKPEFKDKDGNKKKKKDLTPNELKTLKAYDERCRKLAVKFLCVPSMNRPMNEQLALPFLKQITKLSDAGFVLVAIDNKTSEAFNYGIQLLQRYFKDRRLFRTADTYYEFPKETSPVSSLEDDYARGYTWNEVSKMRKVQRDALGAAIAQQADAAAIHAVRYLIGKRPRKRGKGQADLIVEGKVFEFQKLCKGLESFDKTGVPSDLMELLRF